jgi:putative hemolysin
MARRLLCAVLLCAALLPLAASALLNPAAVYCTGLNYTYAVEETEYGQIGVCLLPGNQPVDAWQFLQGTEGREAGYCALMGYETRTVTDPETCAGIYADSCAVCVLPDGREAEVTALMDLSFREPDLVIEPAACEGGVCAAATTEEAAPPSTPEAASPLLLPLAALGAAAVLLRIGRKE